MICDELTGLLYHSLKIEGVSEIQHKYILDTLIHRNCVAYDTTTDQWYGVSGTNENEYKMPTKLVCTAGDGRTKLERKASYEPDPLGCFYLTFNETDETWYDYIWHIAGQLADLKIAIMQNAKAMKTPMIIGVADKDFAESMKQAEKDRQDGDPLIVVQKSVASAMQGQETKVTYVADKLLYLYNEIRSQFLTRIGFLTRVNNTEQRIQSAQVYAVVGEAHDSIHTPIDHWNNQMEDYGLPNKMTLNGCLDEVYTNALMITANDGDGKEGEPIAKGSQYEDDTVSN